MEKNYCYFSSNTIWLFTGHTRKISIPDCVEFHITTNACRGFCESWAVPSALDTLRVNPHQAITSVGQCCNIMDTEDVSELPILIFWRNIKCCTAMFSGIMKSKFFETGPIVAESLNYFSNIGLLHLRKSNNHLCRKFYQTIK